MCVRGAKSSKRPKIKTILLQKYVSACDKGLCLVAVDVRRCHRAHWGHMYIIYIDNSQRIPTQCWLRWESKPSPPLLMLRDTLAVTKKKMNRNRFGPSQPHFWTAAANKRTNQSHIEWDKSFFLISHLINVLFFQGWYD